MQKTSDIKSEQLLSWVKQREAQTAQKHVNSYPRKVRS